MSKTAIDAPRGTIFQVNPEDVVIIGLDTPDGEEHPLYDRRIFLPVNEGLGYDLAEMGNLEPITVRKNGDRLEVTIGRQRVRAARWINEKLRTQGAETVRLHALVKGGTDDRLMGQRISENAHRTNDTPMNNARNLARYLDIGRTMAEAARRFGVADETLRLWRILLDLHPDIQAAVDAGTISANAAAQLHGMRREDQPKFLAELVAGGTVTANAVKAKRAGRSGAPNAKLLATVAKLAWDSKTVPADCAEVLLWAAGSEKNPDSLPEWLPPLIEAAKKSLAGGGAS